MVNCNQGVDGGIIFHLKAGEKEKKDPKLKTHIVLSLREDNTENTKQEKKVNNPPFAPSGPREDVQDKTIDYCLECFRDI